MISSRLSQAAEESLRRVADLASLQAKTDIEIRQTVISCASIIEAYADAVIETLISMSGVSGSPVGSAVLGELEQDFARNWSRRNYWFGVATGTRFAGETYGQAALSLVDLRNALAHGTGGISRLQAREPDGGILLLRRLSETLDVRSVGRRLIAGPSTARRATLIARDFILALDTNFVQQGEAALSAPLAP